MKKGKWAALPVILLVAACGTTAAHSTAHAASVSTSSALTAWARGPGGADLLVVRGDLNQLQADASQGLPLESDGTKLADDAGTAGHNPPPAGYGNLASDYIVGMGALSAAGIDISQDNMTQATSMLTLGARALEAVSAIVGQVTP